MQVISSYNILSSNKFRKNLFSNTVKTVKIYELTHKQPHTTNNPKQTKSIS